MTRRAALAALVVLAAACTDASAPSTTAVPTTGPPAASTTLGGQPSVITTTTPTTMPTTAPETTTTLQVPLPAPPIGPEPVPPEPGRLPAAGSTGIAVVARGGADLAAEPGGEPFVRAHEGLVFPVEGREGDSLRILTNCLDAAWVAGSEIDFVPTREAVAAGPGFDLEEAVVVIDPGHGGDNTGAVGPSGLVEKEVNLDIARRARDLMSAPHDVDWATGTVIDGGGVPALGTVWLTRAEGPAGADIDTGLTFRSQLANMAGADALVSIHNNAEPDGPFDGPGSEVFYRLADVESRRLAGIMIEELRLSLGRFPAAWVGDTDAGAKYRASLDDPDRDYYGLLRRAAVPAVLAEGGFISNPDEEALLATPEFRQAYAEAVYRAVVRFLSTDDPGSGYTEPYRRETPAGSGAPRPTCEVPAQP